MLSDYNDCWGYPKEAIDAEFKNTVPTTRKINDHALTDDISLTASDVNAVPTTRKINDHALTDDISLTASDVNAISSSLFSSGNATINTTNVDGTNAFILWQKLQNMVVVTGYIPTSHHFAANDEIATGLPVIYYEMVLNIHGFDNNGKVADPVMKINSSGKLLAVSTSNAATSIRFTCCYISKN